VALAVDCASELALSKEPYLRIPSGDATRDGQRRCLVKSLRKGEIKKTVLKTVHSTHLDTALTSRAFFKWLLYQSSQATANGARMRNDTNYAGVWKLCRPDSFSERKPYHYTMVQACHEFSPGETKVTQRQK
jgi:hypothetical protein